MDGRVLEFLTSAACGRIAAESAPAPGAVREPDEFESLAIEVFFRQYEENAGYRSWCDALGVAPRSVTRSAEIPAVPVAAFKELELCRGTPAAEFRTSGTGGAGQGRHLLPSLDHYRASAMRNFAACVMPEGWKLRALALAPPPRVRPFSSLSRMLEWVLEEHGAAGSGWFVSERGLESEKLAAALLDSQAAGAQVLLAGSTAAFIAFLSFCDAEGIRLELPGGSRLMDTGGQKGSGSGGVLPLAEFQERFRRRVAATLGIPAHLVVNEYGMTELCTQFYDSSLVDRLARREEVPGPRLKLVPAWARVSAVDPVTLSPLPGGETGMLRVVDLANAGSVIAVQTEDLGTVVPGGFVLEGRPRAAEARGCGLTFDELARGGEKR